MPRSFTLPPVGLDVLQPLAPPTENVSTGRSRPSPHVSYVRALLGQSATESNAREFGAELKKPKRIVICADGTWNSPKTKKGEDASTNVWRLFELVKKHADDGKPQLKYYHAGVGTTGSKFDRIIDGVSGRGLSANMQDCYRFLVEHYQPGDALYLFGFSRGAFTARTLAGLIRNCGIVDPKKVDAAGLDLNDVLKEAFKLYRDRDPDTLPVASRAVDFRANNSHPDFRIAGIGVWDTVGALGIPIDNRFLSPIRWFNESRAGFHDVTLSAYVDYAFHALALDERRGPFKPTLWVQQQHAKAEGQVLEQVWFTGVHSDVGGGYGATERGLANVSLRWMVNRVTHHCGLDFDVHTLLKQEAAGGKLVVHDSMGLLYRFSKPFHRVVDGGLRFGGVRDAEPCITERPHGSALRFAELVAQNPFDPSNVREYSQRYAERRDPVIPPPAQLDRRHPGIMPPDFAPGVPTTATQSSAVPPV